MWYLTEDCVGGCRFRCDHSPCTGSQALQDTALILTRQAAACLLLVLLSTWFCRQGSTCYASWCCIMLITELCSYVCYAFFMFCMCCVNLSLSTVSCLPRKRKKEELTHALKYGKVDTCPQGFPATFLEWNAWLVLCSYVSECKTMWRCLW